MNCWIVLCRALLKFKQNQYSTSNDEKSLPPQRYLRKIDRLWTELKIKFATLPLRCFISCDLRSIKASPLVSNNVCIVIEIGIHYSSGACSEPKSNTLSEQTTTTLQPRPRTPPQLPGVTTVRHSRRPQRRLTLSRHNAQRYRNSPSDHSKCR